MGMMTQVNMGSFNQSPTSAWVFISGAAELTNRGSPVIAIALNRFLYPQIHPQTIETARNNRPDVIEVALAHKEQDRVRAAYNRAEFSNELRRLWQDWGNLCDEKEAAARAVNVVIGDFRRVAA
jgi:hypothetical protein